jgi:hypothetical protein
MIAEIDQALSEVPNIKDEEALINFFTKDMRQVVRKLG